MHIEIHGDSIFSISFSHSVSRAFRMLKMAIYLPLLPEEIHNWPFQNSQSWTKMFEELKEQTLEYTNNFVFSQASLYYSTVFLQNFWFSYNRSRKRLYLKKFAHCCRCTCIWITTKASEYQKTGLERMRI